MSEASREVSKGVPPACWRCRSGSSDCSSALGEIGHRGKAVKRRPRWLRRRDPSGCSQLLVAPQPAAERNFSKAKRRAPRCARQRRRLERPVATTTTTLARRRLFSSGRFGTVRIYALAFRLCGLSCARAWRARGLRRLQIRCSGAPRLDLKYRALYGSVCLARVDGHGKDSTGRIDRSMMVRLRG